jgi:hypothetical protein
VMWRCREVAISMSRGGDVAMLMADGGCIDADNVARNIGHRTSAIAHHIATSPHHHIPDT